MLQLRALTSASILAVAALTITGCGQEGAETALPDDAAAAEKAAGLLAQRLQGRLSEAMMEGGPSAAVNVCAVEAGAIAAEVSAETGFSVGRTSLRVRNEGNAPDPWEREQLEHFAGVIAAGEPLSGLSVTEVVSEEGKETFRWAKPIVMGPVCATCHGVTVEPELLAEIRALYPGDQATGFEVGELRGIFTVQRPLDPKG